MSPKIERVVPRAPRLNIGADIVRAGERVIITSGTRRTVLKGATARTVASKLLPLLDGTHTVDELAARTGMERKNVDTVLRLLGDRMLLEADTDLPPGAVIAAETTAFYAGYRHLLGAHDGVGALVRTLRRGEVLLAGPDFFVDPLRELLEESGLRAERYLEDDGPHGPSGDSVLLVDIETGPPPSQRLPDRDATAWAAPLLRVRCSDSHIEIGPYITANTPNCLQCLDRGREEAGWETSTSSGTDSATVALDCGFVANEIVAFSARSVTALGRYEMRRLDLHSWTSDTCVVTPYLDCPDCRAKPRADWSRADTVVDAYESASSLRPIPMEPVEAESMKRRKQVEDLHSVRESHDTHPRITLARPDVPTRRSTEEGTEWTQRPGLNTLSFLLSRTVGFRRFEDSGDRSRWAPSGGDLGSVEAYVLIPNGVDGLPGNLFKYMDRSHDLLAVSPVPVVLGSKVELGQEASGYSCLVMLVSDHHRIAEKYGDFAIRLARLDVGCAVTQLRTVAHELGLTIEDALRWEPELNDIVLLEGRGRSIAAVAAIGWRKGDENADIHS